MKNGDWHQLNAKVPVSRETFARLQMYHDILLRWSKIKNLIAQNTMDQIWTRHFLDSLQLRSLIPKAMTVVDLGSGAGFPGLVLAIQMMENQGTSVHLIESDNRKAAFLREVIRDIGAPAIVHNGRIEDVLQTLPIPDVVTARALAPLTKLVSLSESLVSAGAVGVFMKGQDFQSELTLAEASCRFSFSRVRSITDSSAAIILVRSKESQCV